MKILEEKKKKKKKSWVDRVLTNSSDYIVTSNKIFRPTAIISTYFCHLNLQQNLKSKLKMKSTPEFNEF